MIRILLAFLVGAVLTAGAYTLKPLLSPPPASVHVSEQAKQADVDVKDDMTPHVKDLLTGDTDTRRRILDEHFFAPRVAEARKLYPVQEQVLEIDGVYTEVFTPVRGLSPRNENRVLINLHGGAFSMGARTEGRLESIPVAHVAGMKIVSVDYRQGLEHKFPAGTEDVVKVYRHLLKNHKPGEIGIFGCSAGGLLTAQTVAWLQAHELPRPGAIGIFCSGAGKFRDGDARIISAAFGTNFGADEAMPYFEGADWNDPLVAPQEHPSVLAQFPPTLVITSTRDMAMSSALVTHQRLVGEGVPAELHVYEGLRHYFFSDTSLPESRQVFDVIASFFDRNLALP